MAVDLRTLLRPVRVRDEILPFDGKPEAAKFADEVCDAILCGIGRNPEYRFEMVQVWSMCYLATERGDAEVNFEDLPATLSDAELANVARRVYDGDRRTVVMGSILAELGFRRVASRYRTGVVAAATAAENERLVAIVEGCAVHCPFDKTGDTHLHTLVRLLLPAAEEAAVGEQTPFDAMDRSYDKQTSINLVRPLFEQMPAKRVESLVYSAGARACDLVLVCGVVGEHIDNATMTVEVNGRLLTQPAEKTGMFAFRSFGSLADGYGIYVGDELLYADAEYPVCSVVKAWAKNTAGADSLFVALTDPAALASSSKFKQMLVGRH